MKNDSKKGSLVGIVVVLWFIGSVAGMISQLINNPYISAILFGQIFVGFGILIIGNVIKEKRMGNKENPLPAIPFLVIGLTIIIIAVLMKNPSLYKVDINWSSVVMILVSLSFILAGICAIIFPKIITNHLKKVCTVSIPATILRYETYIDRRNTLYAPVYSYIFNNKNYEVCKEQYTNIKVRDVGTKVELKVNPRNPEEFMDNETVSKGTIIIGIIFLILAIPLFIFVIKNFSIFK